MHIIFSSIHARTPRVLKYPKQTGRANFRVYPKNIVSKRRDEIVTKRDDEYQCYPLRIYETPPFPPAPDPVSIENCKQLFSPLLAFTTQKIATRSTDIISAARVAFFLGRKCNP